MDGSLAGIYSTWLKFHPFCISIPQDLFQPLARLAFWFNRHSHYAGGNFSNGPTRQAQHILRNKSRHCWAYPALASQPHTLIIDNSTSVSNSTQALASGFLFSYGRVGFDILYHAAQWNFAAVGRLSPKDSRRLFRDLVSHAWAASKIAFITILSLAVHFFLFDNQVTC